MLFQTAFPETLELAQVTLELELSGFVDLHVKLY